jgi:hypothetical protein
MFLKFSLVVFNQEGLIHARQNQGCWKLHFEGTEAADNEKDHKSDLIRIRIIQGMR